MSKLSLSFPPPSSSSLSSSHSLSLFFSWQHTPSWTFGHTPFWRRDVNVLISFVLADVNRAFSSSVFAFLAFEAIAGTKAQALCVAALCGWGKKFSMKRNFWEMKNSMKIIFLSKKDNLFVIIQQNSLIFFKFFSSSFESTSSDIRLFVWEKMEKSFVDVLDSLSKESGVVGAIVADSNGLCLGHTGSCK